MPNDTLQLSTPVIHTCWAGGDERRQQTILPGWYRNRSAWPRPVRRRSRGISHPVEAPGASIRYIILDSEACFKPKSEKFCWPWNLLFTSCFCGKPVRTLVTSQTYPIRSSVRTIVLGSRFILFCTAQGKNRECVSTPYGFQIWYLANRPIESSASYSSAGPCFHHHHH